MPAGLIAYALVLLAGLALGFLSGLLVGRKHPDIASAIAKTTSQAQSQVKKL